MIAAEKPPLEAVYFAHAGVKGMKWGVRKAPARVGQRLSRGFHNASPAKRAAIGVASVGAVLLARKVTLLSGPKQIALGATVAAALLAREGKRPVRPAGGG